MLKTINIFSLVSSSGIIRIAVLSDTEQNCFLSVDSRWKRLNKKFNFLQYLQYPFIHSVFLEKGTRL